MGIGRLNMSANPRFLAWASGARGTLTAMGGGKTSRMHTPVPLNGSSGRLRRPEAGRLNVLPASTRGAETPRTVAEAGFGPHLVFDGFGCPADRLEDLTSLYRLLDGLPDRIRMTKIMPPYVFRHGLPDDPAAGLSGFVLIAESHISLHTFPGRGYVNADVFSCKTFDVQDALAAFRDAFGPARVEWKLLDRGREFPKHIAASRAIVAGDRRVVARGLGLEASR
jgi:S-adenosylmethionine decarboxylase